MSECLSYSVLAHSVPGVETPGTSARYLFLFRTRSWNPEHGCRQRLVQRPTGEITTHGFTCLPLPRNERHPPNQQVRLRVEPKLVSSCRRGADSQQHPLPILNGGDGRHRPRHVVEQSHHGEGPLGAICRLGVKLLAVVADHCFPVRNVIRRRLGRSALVPLHPKPVWALDTQSHGPGSPERARGRTVLCLKHNLSNLYRSGMGERRSDVYRCPGGSGRGVPPGQPDHNDRTGHGQGRN